MKRWITAISFVLAIAANADHSFDQVKKEERKREVADAIESISESTPSEGTQAVSQQKPIQEQTVVAEASDKAQSESSKEKVEGGYISGRWAGTGFEYKTADGKWATPTTYKVATEKDPGSFKNAKGETVDYKPGDILFRIGNLGWFKAKKDSPKVEDSMVPNPFGVKLNKYQYDAIRATNVFRAKHGKPALVVDPILTRTAGNRLQMNHNANGMSSWAEAAKNGFRGQATDNLSGGDRSGQGSLNNLVADGPGEGHYEQVMGRVKVNGRWTEMHPNRIGVATSGPGGVWVHIYGRARD